MLRGLGFRGLSAVYEPFLIVYIPQNSRLSEPQVEFTGFRECRV